MNDMKNETTSVSKEVIDELVIISTLKDIIEDRVITEDEKIEFEQLINFQYS